ncbi:translation initiation factor IF-2 [Enterocloster bolteae]|uniref:translation initiation factor IF-2 n=1 Tax=Enterocloster bolteae TaxID=208479 RepID=UPI001D15B60B|nr:translation initiation factor IF-2 [Enterocloster bolteae]MCC3390277.1 translation initiation factor IF-2 [Enterocloster bolteae]
MRVSELANELGKTSKEILEIIKTKDKAAVLYAASNVTKDQENIVRSFANPKREAKPAAPEHRTEAPKTEASRAEAPRTEAPRTEAPKTEAARSQDSASKGEPAKKKLTAVFRPQNAQQQIKRPVPPKPQAANQGHTTPAPAAAPQPAQAAAPAASAVPAEAAKPQVQAQSADTVSEKAAAPQPSATPQAGAHAGTQQTAQDSRDTARSQGGYQGNRDNNRSQGGGYQGNRPQGGYGARPQGGYQGRPGDDKDARDNRGRNDSRRPAGARDGKSSFDTPIQTKPTSNRQNKNSHKNDRFDKRDRLEDGKKKVPKTGKGAFIMPQPKKEESKADEVKTITLPDVLTIKELAEKMKLQPSVIVKKLFLKGQVVTLNQEIDYEQAEEIAMEFDVLCEKEVKVDVIAELLKEDEESTEDMVPRSPVVCVMGHVDHGKTSLLDAIRETNVTAREAGGITQHIGASVIEINDRKITFLDTPGHEAFTAMRMRGAQSTDIAILVVAADDGVMPQTVEAINHAKAANVEIIVAINKIDKPSANVDKVKQELAEYELIPEDWGGSTIFVPVSAHTKEGIKDLLEMVLLTADVLELKANPNRKGRGLVIEAELDKGKGPVATVLVQKGTLRVGETIAAGACFGKIRAMMDDRGRRVKEAGPSTPVEILGLNDVPNAGEVFVATENEKEARNFAETFISEGKSKLIEDTKAKLSLDDLFSQIQAGNVKELPIIVKADVQGSVEAVKQSLTKLSNEEVMVKVIHGGVGAINESDVSLASASNAIIIGFNIRPDATAKSIAEREKVDIRLYKVIYQAIEDVEAAMKGMLDPVFEEKVIGHAVIRQTFKASGIGTIAGSYVLDGKFQRNCSCRVKREGEQIFEGPLASLKRFKDDVKEVAAGYECGLVFEKFNDLQEDDEIEAYIMVEVPR